MQVITSDTAPKGATDNKDRDGIKVGMHMYFPLIFVDSATHLKLRSYLLVKAVDVSQDHIGLLDGDEGCLLINKWADVLDAAVCGQPKLRMMCSRKAAPCKHTAEEKKELKCGRKHDVGRLYRVIDVTEHDGTRLTRNPRLFTRFAAATGYVIDHDVNLVRTPRLFHVLFAPVHTNSHTHRLKRALTSYKRCPCRKVTTSPRLISRKTWSTSRPRQSHSRLSPPHPSRTASAKNRNWILNQVHWFARFCTAVGSAKSQLR